MYMLYTFLNNTHIHKYIHAYAYTHVCVIYVYTYINGHVSMDVCNMCMHANTYIYTCLPTYIYA